MMMDNNKEIIYNLLNTKIIHKSNNNKSKSKESKRNGSLN